MAPESVPRAPLKVTAMEAWLPKWPRPQDNVGDVEVPWLPTGIVDLGPLQHLASDSSKPAQRLASKWWKAFCHKGSRPEETTVSLFELVHVCTVHPALRSLLSQVLVAASLEIDKVMGNEVKTLAFVESTFITFIWHDLNIALNNRHVVQRTCAQHLLAGVALTRGENVYNMAVDKGSAGGLPLMFGFVTLPNNLAILLTPMVSHGNDSPSKPTRTMSLSGNQPRSCGYG